MSREWILNKYYNMGGYNLPCRIGYMMKMIRELRPITIDEWQIWYLNNVHPIEYIEELASDMNDSIPSCYNSSFEECFEYICNVMFKRTFDGFNKEKIALRFLRKHISQNVFEAPEDWDTLYFIDFYFHSFDGKLIGIQLKPKSFFAGGYNRVVNIEGKMKKFREEFNAETYILIYSNKMAEEYELEVEDPVLLSSLHNLAFQQTA